MIDFIFSLLPDLTRRDGTRIAECEFAHAGDYMRELIERDLDEAADAAWVRGKFEAGVA